MSLKRGVCLVSAGAALGVGLPAAGQGTARVTAIVRVVKTGSARAPGWRDARLGAALDEGDRLRTGRRSKAGMRFRDGSAVRVDELSEVVVRSGARDATVNRGALYGSYRGPGTVSGGYAVAAVKGTQFEFRTRGKATRVRCYSGVVYVGAAGADVRAGAADGGAGNTLTDDALIGQTRPWVGTTLRLMSGPDAGQQHRITGFDAATGTVTVDPPFEHPAGLGVDYLLTTRADLPVVILDAGMETTVREGQAPSPPRRAVSPAFAGGEEHPWFAELVEGSTVQVYPGSPRHEEDQASAWVLDEAIEQTGGLQEAFGDVSVLQGKTQRQQPSGGGAEIIIGVPSQPTGPTDQIPVPGSRTGIGSVKAVRTAAFDAASPSGSASGHLPRPASGGGATWDLEPYAFGADEGETVGGRARLRGFQGRVMAEVGGRIARFAGNEEIDLSEASLLYRAGRWGDLKVGRQHLFVGPANNSELGTLVGFNTADAALWNAPAGRRFGWSVGYLADSAPLQGDGFSGWYGRGRGVLGGGLWGVTLLSANRAGGGLGASADVSFPLLRDRLDGYVEAGRDPFDHDLVTGGFYFPGLFQRTGVDAFLEYQSRGGFNDRVSLQLRTQVAPHWLVVGYVTQELGGKTSGGAGVRYGWQWR
jgi:FecR protein